MKIYQRLDPLTSLRFFAAAMIVIGHIEGLNILGFDTDSPPLLQWVQGVSFFFVLSGFILTYIYPKLETWPEIGRFWRARFARIWPALFASFILAFWLLSLDWEYKTGFANLLMVNAWIPIEKYIYPYNTPSWSISTEFFFYLLFPLLIYKWDKNWQIKLLVSFVVVVTLISISNLLKLPMYAYEVISKNALLKINPISRIFEFIFGMFVASLWRKQVKETQWSESRATLYEIGAILLAVTSMHYTYVLTRYVGSTWLGPGTSYWLAESGVMFFFGLLIYIMAIGRGRISAWLSHPSMVLLGEISFSLYLLHYILLRYYVENTGLFPKLPNMLSLAIFWAVVLLASYVMWSLIEMPSRRLILGRGQKHMHGTKVMQQSWHSHFNLNRKTVSAAVALFCIVTSIYISLGNNPNRISETEANETTLNHMKYVVGTRFGDLFMLRGIRIVRQQEGLGIYFAWESLVEQELTYTTRVYLTDTYGKDLVFASMPQPKARAAEKQGAIWGDVILIPSDKLRGIERKVGITVYQDSSNPLLVDRGYRDRNNHRLLIDLGYAM